jgi:hypothetical protein
VREMVGARLHNSKEVRKTFYLDDTISLFQRGKHFSHANHVASIWRPQDVPPCQLATPLNDICLLVFNRIKY